MRLKPKRRLILLACAGGIVAVGAFAGLFVRRWQHDRLVNRYLNEGVEAWKAHNYYDALGSAGAYLNRTRNDAARLHDPRRADALLAYADSRRRIDEPNGSNYHDCIQFYQQYLQLRPDDREAALALLKTYNLCSQGTEAYKLADQLLPADKKYTAADLPVLREKALGYLSANAFKDVADTVKDITAVAPLDVQAHSILFAALEKQTNRGAARATADALLKEHPSDGSALLIAAISREIDPTQSDALQAVAWARGAGGLDPQTGAPAQAAPPCPSAEYVYSVVEVLDRFRHFDDSLAVLRLAAPKIPDDGLLRTLARRLWQLHADQELAAATDGVKPDPWESDPDIMAFRALALIGQKRPGDAAPLEAALAGRFGDFRARAWTKAIPLMDPARAPKSAVDAAGQWAEVVKINPNEAIFQEMLGESYAALGRSDEAIDLWKKAADYKPAMSWSLPAYRIAQSLLAQGHEADAAMWATTAVQIGQNRLTEALLWLEAQSAAIQKGVTPAGAMSPDEMLKQVEVIRTELHKSQMPPEALRACEDRMLIPRVVLMSRAGQRDQARAEALAALDQTPPLSAALIQRLAATGRAENLGVQDECVKRLAATGSGDAAVAQAAQLADAGKIEDALKLLREAGAKNLADLNLQAALPRLLEAVGREDEAAKAWVALGEAHPDSLAVQRMCLQSTAAPADKEFLERAIGRYLKLSGLEPESQDTTVLIARARALLHGTPSRLDHDKAVAMLGVVCGRQGAPVEARMLLASALASSGDGYPSDPTRAAGQLRAVLEQDPRNVAVALQLARILQSQRDFAGAAELLRRITSDTSADAASRRIGAEMLIRQGEVNERVVSILADSVAQMGERTPPSTLVMLAEAYTSLRQDALAGPLYEKLAAGAADTLDSVYMTARHFALAGDQEKLGTVLALLDKVKGITVAQRELVLGQIEADQQHAGPDQKHTEAAIKHFEAAATAEPHNEELWSKYVAAVLQLSGASDAERVAARAAAANPESKVLAALGQQLQALATGGVNSDLATLIGSLGADAGASEALKALQSLQASYAAGQFDDPDQLENLANRFEKFLGVQAFVMNRLVATSPERAAAIAERAMAAHPGDGNAARDAALVYLQIHQWEPMLRAAERWRLADQSRSAEPDLAIAQACLGLGQYDRGRAAIADRLPGVVQNPATQFGADLLNMEARLLIGSGHEERARALLAPLLTRDSKVRQVVWPGIMRDALTPDMRKVWLEQLRPVLSAGDADDRLAWGMLLFTLGDLEATTGGTEAANQRFNEAAAVFSGLTNDPKTASAAAFEALGIALFRAGDSPGAEKAFRRAIELDPKRPGSLNNLAYIALQTHGDYDAALDLAERAVQAEPSSAANVDTLATVYGKLGERDLAKGDAAKAKEHFTSSAKNWAIKARLAMDPWAMYNAGVSYDSAGATASAIEAYRSALTYPNLAKEVVVNAKNNLAMDLLRHPAGRQDVDRALTLISEAIRVSDTPEFEDTKGWAMLSRGDRVAAEQAFSRALELFHAAQQEKHSTGDEFTLMPGTVIGRAMALAELGADHRAEATALLDRVTPGQLSAEDRARYDEARSALK